MTLKLDDYRLLGRSGLRVSPLSLGTMTFGMPAGWGSSDEDARHMFDTYVDRGGNFLDTANFYGSGGSEKVIGEFLKGRRERMVVATKYSLTMRAGDPNGAGNHRKNMVRAVEESLQRLQTDYIDLYYLHIWDSRTPVEEILRGFDDLVRAGKIIYAGISDTPVWQVSRMQAIAELRGWSPFIALQIPYNLTERTVERDFFPMAREMGMGVLPWSPLAGGVLSGKYTRDDLKAPVEQTLGALNSRKSMNLARGRLNERTLDIADAVSAIAKEMGRSPSQVALAWTLLNPAVTSPLIGARTYPQFEDNLAALEINFSDAHIKQLDEVSRIEACFPHDMLNGEISKGLFGGVNIEKPRWQ
ncbi:MAG: aldo/keto reductase [Spongiibacteraceae bacterium]